MQPAHRSSAAPRAVLAPTHFVDVEGRRLAYRSIGDGPPLVLCQRLRGVLCADAIASFVRSTGGALA